MDFEFTVLMAVRNGRPFLNTAIDSILSQTCPNFSFLIVDDASTDNTREIVQAYQDDRIKLMCLEKNVGQTAALNVGLREASTPWIARMDADDYSAPTRFDEQIRALNADRSLKCVGTFAWTFRDDPQIVEEVLTRPVNYDDIQRVVATVPIIHGSILVHRMSLIEVGAYNDRYLYSADLEMYDRFLAKHAAANVPKQLLGIRHHSGQGSRTRVALDETIEILTRRLSVHQYTQEEAATVKSIICRTRVERARRLVGERRVLPVLKDLVHALQDSKKRFLWYFILFFAIYNLSHRYRTQLKKMLRPIHHANSWRD